MASTNVTNVEAFSTGTGKVIRVGDTVRVDPSRCRSNVRGSYRFRVKEIRHHDDDTVEITVFGGKPQREQFHTFVPEVLHVCRKAVAR